MSNYKHVLCQIKSLGWKFGHILGQILTETTTDI